MGLSMGIERVHWKAIIIGMIASIVSSVIVAVVVTQATVTVQMRETISVNTAKIAQLQFDVGTLQEADKKFVSREEYENHWKEQQYFQERVDTKMDAIMTQHSRMIEMLAQHMQHNKPTSYSDLPPTFDKEMR